MSSGIARIKKLLSLARSKNKHEAEAARSRAQELMDAHGVDVIDEDEDITREIIESVRDDDRIDLARTIAHSRRCSAGVHAEVGAIAIIGRRSPVTDAASYYREVVTFAVPFENVGSTAPASVCRAYRHVYWKVFAESITARLRTAAAPPTVDETIALAQSLTPRQQPPESQLQAILQKAADDVTEMHGDAAEDIMYRLIDRATRTGTWAGERAPLRQWSAVTAKQRFRLKGLLPATAAPRRGRPPAARSSSHQR